MSGNGGLDFEETGKATLKLFDDNPETHLWQNR
jgi:hypothetical protein